MTLRSFCSGKSTVGKLVADALDYPLLDSDEVAEEFADCTIAEIFKNEGEEAFRDLESRVLQVGQRLPAVMLYKCDIIISPQPGVLRLVVDGFTLASVP